MNVELAISQDDCEFKRPKAAISYVALQRSSWSLFV
jgi:hypothetical protein